MFHITKTKRRYGKNIILNRPGEVTNVNLVENIENTIPLSLVNSSISDSLNHNIIDANIFSIIYRLTSSILGFSLTDKNIFKEYDDLKNIKKLINNLYNNNYEDFNLLYSKHIISILNKINKVFIRFLKVHENENNLIKDNLTNIKNLLNNVKTKYNNIDKFELLLSAEEDKINNLIEKEIISKVTNINLNVKIMINNVNKIITNLNKSNQINITKQLFYSYSKINFNNKDYKNIILLNNIYDNPLPEIDVNKIYENLDNIGIIDLRDLKFRRLTLPQITKEIYFYSSEDGEKIDRDISPSNSYGLNEISILDGTKIPGLNYLIEKGREFIKLKNLFLEDLKDQYVNINVNNLEASELGEDLIPFISNLEDQVDYIKGIIKKPPKSAKKFSLILPFHF